MTLSTTSIACSISFKLRRASSCSSKTVKVVPFLLTCPCDVTQGRDDRQQHTYCMQQQLQAAEGIIMQQQDIEEQLKDPSITSLERELLEKMSRMRTALNRPVEQLYPPGFDAVPPGYRPTGRLMQNSHLYL